MKSCFVSCLVLLFFAGCKKEQGPRIDIYVLKSFTSTVDLSTNPVTFLITNAVLENTAWVADRDILFYKRATTSFILRKKTQLNLQNYGPDKAFAVTVDDQPVYYGRFHPAYLSSISFGVATISSALNNELKIDFPSIEGNLFLQQLDKRNDSRLINSLKATNRLR